MVVVLFVCVGLVVGAIAHIVAPSRGPEGWLSACVAGAIGAVLGGAVGRVATLYRGEVPTSGVFFAVLVSAAFAATERVLARRQALR